LETRRFLDRSALFLVTTIYGMDEKQTVHHEGAPWFWKLFGGAIIGLMTGLLVLFFSTISSNIQQYRNDVQGTQSKMWSELNALKAELATIKEKCSTTETGWKERAVFVEKEFTALKASDKDQDAKIMDLRERLLRIEEKSKLSESKK
jgi:hypothetical protein